MWNARIFCVTFQPLCRVVSFFQFSTSDFTLLHFYLVSEMFCEIIQAIRCTRKLIWPSLLISKSQPINQIGYIFLMKMLGKLYR